jgi:hypothetical protein
MTFADRARRWKLRLNSTTKESNARIAAPCTVRHHRDDAMYPWMLIYPLHWRRVLFSNCSHRLRGTTGPQFRWSSFLIVGTWNRTFGGSSAETQIAILLSFYTVLQVSRSCARAGSSILPVSGPCHRRAHWLNCSIIAHNKHYSRTLSSCFDAVASSENICWVLIFLLSTWK